MTRFTSLEQRIDVVAHAILDRLPQSGIWGGLVEFLVFGLKQAWACLFGGLMLAAVIGTHYFWPQDSIVARYDFLFLFALGVQITMLLFRLEKIEEAKVILIFHVVGTVMELFKTNAGSWVYPEANLFRIADVPLFSGFMYAAVGSYLARVSRIFDFRYTQYPRFEWSILLAAAIYVNFFTHHFGPDVRLGLFLVVAILYGRTWIHYRVFRFRLKMPLLLGFLLVALFIWFAENIGTWSRAWLYPGQEKGWTPVSIYKLGSWYLLMIISFVLVTFVHKPQPLGEKLTSPQWD
jgi:uncharacterized membrane protein YoaT (DUF817 family)